MGTIAIRAEGIAKQYRIGSSLPYRTLRDLLAEGVRALRRGRGPGRASGDSIWALEGVSFEVLEGEVVGIIGRNGAGKSTLLRILSRITKPTRGEVQMRGRAGALLEVGTGFHPELTGRENVFLSGSLLGMRRSQIMAKFDEIVAFSGIERFLDTPVKRYSSGMFMRLAFAVAAHLEPEILIVDEVLSVGDAAFQRKCLSKMEEVGRGGRTVLFVSHNLPAVARLCPRTILLDGGRIVRDGPTHEVAGFYLSSGGTPSERAWSNVERAPGNDVARLLAVRVRNQEMGVAPTFDIRKPVGIELEFLMLKEGEVVIPHVGLFNDEGLCVFVSAEIKSRWYLQPRPRGRFRCMVWIPGNFLAEGSYFVSAGVSRWNPSQHHVYERDVVAFRVVDTLEGDSARGDFGGDFPGIVRPLLEWTGEFEPVSQ